MTIARTAYYSSLAGAVAGFSCWTAVTVLSFVAHYEQFWADLVAKVLLGTLIGGVTIGFQDDLSGNRVMVRWILFGVAAGSLAGLISGIIDVPIANSIAPVAPFASRVMAWILVGAAIGSGMGLRWISKNPARFALSAAGGLAGGTVGGFLLSAFASTLPDSIPALSYAVTGIGVGLGCAAPAAGTTGLIEFISSGDATTQHKLSRSVHEWPLRDGVSYLVGRKTPIPGDPEAARSQIWLPDVQVAGRHARLYSREGRFFIARHSDISEQSARYVIRAGGKTVTSAKELQDSDEILIGRTVFRFSTRRKDGR